VLDSLKIVIPLPEEMLQQEKSRLEKERDKLSSNLERLQNQLKNEEFVKNAPAELIDKQKRTQQQTENELKEIAAKLQKLALK
jgi:valyl-tRNA synthetase